jgi:hypothetical protein
MPTTEEGAVSNFGRPRFAKAYGFGLITVVLFLLSWTGQAVAQYFVVQEDAYQHGFPFELSEFLWQFAASTFENWQSEFLQLLWQAAGLAMFLYWGSSQSRESDERIEKKLDVLLLHIGRSPDEITQEVHKNL